MTTDIGEIPLINMANVMLATLKSAALREIAAEDCVARLLRQLAQIHENAEAVRGELVERVAAALAELAAAGLLEPLAGARFRITERGRTVLEQHPMGVDETVLAEFRSFHQTVRKLDAAASAAAEAAAAMAESRDYLDGYGAFLGGRPVTDNPHPLDVSEHGEWDAGWFEALDEAVERSPGAAGKEGGDGA